MKYSRIVFLSTIIAASSLSTNVALAGGLFGDGGLIRGDIGNFMDKNVEKPILTPIAKGLPAVVGELAAGGGGDAEPPKTTPPVSCTPQPGKAKPESCL